MKVYQINYDLRKQRDYSSLIKQIKAYQTYANPLESSAVDRYKSVLSPGRGILRLSWTQMTDYLSPTTR